MLTSRERLLRCLRHEPVDRVPVSTYELVGWNPDAWENNEPSYKELMDVIREKTDCLYMVGPGWRSPGSGITESKHWQEGSSRWTETVYHTPKGDLTIRTRQDAGVKTVWTLKHLLETIDDIEKYLAIPYIPPEIDMSPVWKAQEHLSDHGLVMISLADPICVAAELFEMGQFLVYALTNPDEIKYLMDVIHERQMYQLRQILKHDVSDIVFRICGPEYATPPYLAPEQFREFVTPYITEICHEIRDAGGFPRLHSHGKIGRVLDQIVNAGAEGLDPVEPPPDGDITLKEVKERYGDRLCLFGNIELRELENSSSERIELLVKEAMDSAKDGSGFVLMPTAAPINIPLRQKTKENYFTFIEAGLKYGQY